MSELVITSSLKMQIASDHTRLEVERFLHVRLKCLHGLNYCTHTLYYIRGETRLLRQDHHSCFHFALMGCYAAISVHKVKESRRRLLYIIME